MKYKPTVDDWLAAFFFGVLISVLIFAVPIMGLMVEVMR